MRARGEDRVARPRGIFRMRLWRRGQIVEVVEDHNLVVDGMRAVLAELLGAGAPANVVTQIGFGSDATPPSAADVGLANEYRRALGVVSYPAAGQVQFAWQLDAAEANGLAISEWGLYTSGGVLVARKSRVSPIDKAADVSLDGTWTLVF